MDWRQAIMSGFDRACKNAGAAHCGHPACAPCMPQSITDVQNCRAQPPAIFRQAELKRISGGCRTLHDVVVPSENVGVQLRRETYLEEMDIGGVGHKMLPQPSGHGRLQLIYDHSPTMPEALLPVLCHLPDIIAFTVHPWDRPSCPSGESTRG